MSPGKDNPLTSLSDQPIDPVFAICISAARPAEHILEEDTW